MSDMLERRNPGRGKGRRSGRASGRDGGGTVIHVDFARRARGESDAPPGARLSTAPPPAGPEPVTDLFSPREVQKLLGVAPARLRSLDRAGIVTPSGSRSGRRAYTFQDLIALRATRDLLEHQVKMQDVARAIGALRQSLPRVTRPLQELRIVSDGRRVVVRSEDGLFEPISGQMVLDFHVTSLRDDVVRVLRPATSPSRARTAYDLYAKASTLDEDPTTFDEAEALYKEAIRLDPTLAIAYTNLGNIAFRRGDDASAEALYVRALALDDRQPEAHYNLGYVMLERGDPSRAVPHFERAVEADPRFSDAHFNLAMAYEQCGLRAKARGHWRRYLELEPDGTWSDIARKHLG
jgi:Flp pilus assembly protein TadD/DNA-binding transcriptional MerR regulator